MRHYYEALWYNKKPTESEDEGMQKGDCSFKEFASKKKALEYYEKHKNDADKCGWWVTKRDEDGMVEDDYIY